MAISILRVARTFKGEYSNTNEEQWAYNVQISGTPPVDYEVILNACDGTTCIPGYGTELLGTPWIVIDKSISADPLDPTIYRVFVKFGLIRPEWQLAGEGAAAWGHQVEITGVETQEPIWNGYYAGKDGNDSGLGILQKIVNSANQQYNPPLTRTYYDTEIRITYMTNALDGSLDDIRGLLNSDNFTINCQGYVKDVQPGQVKVGNVTATISVGAGQLQLWKVTFPLIYRKDKWIYPIEDLGMFDINGLPIADASGNPVTTPVPLDGQGNKLDLTSGTPTYHTNDYYLSDSVAVKPYISEIT